MSGSVDIGFLPVALVHFSDGLLFIGCIGLNWYGFLVSDFYGNILVIVFFVMMISFRLYQYKYYKSRVCITV